MKKCIVFVTVLLLFVYFYVPLTKRAYQRLKYGLRSLKKVQLPQAASTNDESARLSVKQHGPVVQAHSTVVTLFFKLHVSKHNHSKYMKWNRQFFSSATTVPMVIYTDLESIDALIKLSSLGNNSKTFYVFQDVWSVMRLLEIERRNNDYIQNYKTVQNRLDPERDIHTPSLYAIWNLKSFLMKRTAQPEFNVYKSSFFIYTDMGAFRGGVQPNWPSREHLSQLSPRLGDRVLLGQITPSLDDDPYMTSKHINYIEGGFCAGSAKAVEFFYQKFFDIHD